MTGGLTVGEFSKFKVKLDAKALKIEEQSVRLSNEMDKLAEMEKSLKDSGFPISDEIFKAQLPKSNKEMAIGEAPINLKLDSKQDIGVKVSVYPIIEVTLLNKRTTKI